LFFYFLILMLISYIPGHHDLLNKISNQQVADWKPAPTSRWLFQAPESSPVPARLTKLVGFGIVHHLRPAISE
jgi:hypothetical protein